MCLSPSFAPTEDICDYCIAQEAGKDLAQILDDNGQDPDDFKDYDGHQICSVDWDDWSPVLNACACRNSKHTLAKPRVMYERMIEEMAKQTNKAKERVSS